MFNSKCYYIVLHLVKSRLLMINVSGGRDMMNVDAHFIWLNVNLNVTKWYANLHWSTTL